MKKRRFLVDMDGVIANFNGKLLPLIYGKFPHLLVEMPLEKLRINDTFYTHQWFDNKITKEDVYPLYQQKGFFESLEPIGDCVEMINYLRSSDIDVMFCSTPIIYGEELWSLKEKAEWLRRHFDQWAVKNLILTDDKTIVTGDILIDDKALIIGRVEKPTWKHILFDQPWNQSSKSIRMNGGWTRENMDWLLSEFTN